MPQIAQFVQEGSNQIQSRLTRNGPSMQPMYASGGRPTTFMDNTISGTPGGLMNMTQYGPYG